MWKKNSGKVLLFCVLIGLSAFVVNAQSNDDIDKKKTTTTTTTTSSTTVQPTTEPQTTVEPTTTTTTLKTTTTPKSTTTTSAPTTSAPTTPPPPTTSTPTTSTTPPPTTTTAKPTPKPSTGRWNTSCILIQMAAQFNFTYMTKDNKTAEGIFNLPVDSSVEDFTCQNITQQVNIQWGSHDAPSFLYMEFDKNGTQYILHIMSLHLRVSKVFPDAQDNEVRTLHHIGSTFKTPLQMSYHCTREQVLNMTASIDDTKVVGAVKLTNVQLEAFRTENSTKFSTAKDCDAIDTPDIVPIAVGIALAALILVVLIAYLFARRQNVARGYMSF